MPRTMGTVPRRPSKKLLRRRSTKWRLEHNATHWSTVSSKGRKVHIEFVPPKPGESGLPAGPPPQEALEPEPSTTARSSVRKRPVIRRRKR